MLYFNKQKYIYFKDIYKEGVMANWQGSRFLWLGGAAGSRLKPTTLTVGL